MKATVKTNDIMAAMTSSAAAKSGHPIFEGVHIRVEGNRASVVGCDSYRMVVAESEHEDNEPGMVTLSLAGIKLKKNGYVTIESTEDATSFSIFGGAKHEPPIIEGNYPEWEKLVPEAGAVAEPQSYIGFNPSFVNDLGKAYRVWSDNNKANVWLEFTGEQRPMSMTRRDGNRSFFGVIMPARPKSSDLVLERLKASDGDSEETNSELRAVKRDLKTATEELARAEELAVELSQQVEKLTSQLEESHGDDAESRIDALEAKLELISEAAEMSRQDDTDSKVDALIAELGISVAGKTPCAVYFAGIGKDSPEMEAVKAAGAKFGNHKKYGKCWYIPR